MLDLAGIHDDLAAVSGADISAFERSAVDVEGGREIIGVGDVERTAGEDGDEIRLVQVRAGGGERDGRSRTADMDAQRSGRAVVSERFRSDPRGVCVRPGGNFRVHLVCVARGDLAGEVRIFLCVQDPVKEHRIAVPFDDRFRGRFEGFRPDFSGEAVRLLIPADRIGIDPPAGHADIRRNGEIHDVAMREFMRIDGCIVHRADEDLIVVIVRAADGEILILHIVPARVGRTDELAIKINVLTRSIGSRDSVVPLSREGICVPCGVVYGGQVTGPPVVTETAVGSIIESTKRIALLVFAVRSPADEAPIADSRRLNIRGDRVRSGTSRKIGDGVVRAGSAKIARAVGSVNSVREGNTAGVFRVHDVQVCRACDGVDGISGIVVPETDHFSGYGTGEAHSGQCGKSKLVRIAQEQIFIH